MVAENDTIPDINNMVNEGAWWSYFCFGMELCYDGVLNTPMLDEIYNSEYLLH